MKRSTRTTYTTGQQRHRSKGRRRWPAWVGVAILVPALAMMFASTALGLKTAEKEEFLPFANCPLPAAQGGLCVVSTTTGGEFVIGSKKVPITKPITLQGGLAQNSFAQQPLIAAADGNTLANVAQEVPGGLVGIPPLNLGGEVTATAELAAPASSVLVSPGSTAVPATYPGVAVVLPIKVHLQNELLGENCFIGSNTEPIVLHLYAIHGSNLEFGADFKIEKLPKIVLSDTTFAVPAAKGCGSGSLEELIDTVVNDDIGLPSEAGKNSVEMISSLEQTTGEFAHKYLPKKKKEKKAKKT